ncbi:ABC transporter substrate-binding protein [Nonomuraea roseoviolacea subsp. roseoviolacea]|uniref:Spermidine/putrescine transport system substrate-binding protein n=1 Tax=Nonomuraea roseoviolacea subsp. carminata TaxID=160689 RepID=A0ABT1K2P1_9ACTN|nr:ABC transporter substrate-binding protein [Nonomuraea roseoviolacea]MCP2348266.1 putative spermidine/putrescine transport system substrate-binding protein [Nonomuraea roseoviolacea subsp. carminata]
MTPRRRILLIVLALLAPVAAACGGGAAREPGKLVVSVFGYASDRVERAVVEPFERMTGVDVVVETGANADRLSKLRVNRNAPTVDVVLMSDFYAAMGEKEGLFDKVDEARLPHLAEAHPFARNPGGYGPAYTYALLGMTYRTDRFTAPPGLERLGEPAYRGQVAVPDLAITAGVPFLTTLARAYGSGPADADAAFRALARLKPDVLTFYNRSTELASLLDRGEVVMAPSLDIFAVDLVARGRPVAWAPLDAGRVIVTNRAELVRGSAHRADAERFIDYLLSRETQERAAASFNDKPVNRAAKLPPVLARVTGEAAADPIRAGFRPLDLDLVMRNLTTWSRRFAREIAG